MAQISIPGGSGNTVTFTVTGDSATNYAKAFNAAVGNATTVTTLSTGAPPSTVAGALNIITASNTTTYSLTTPGQYTYAAVDKPTTVNGSSGGDTVLGGGGVGYIAKGSGNNVTFTDGANAYYGVDDGGGNTITAGAGSDTINTGSGSDTVFSGAGSAVINLTDTVGGDIAGLLAGNSLVNAFGVNDTIYASALYDASTTGTIFGGTGNLTFVAGPSDSLLNVTIVGGSGTTNIFGADNTDIVFANTVGSASFIAGTGNETLNAANAIGGISFFGDTVAADAPSNSDLVVGGTGTDYFSTGAGHETIVGGSGAALFNIADIGDGTKITIFNFGAADSVNFGGLSTTDETSLLATATTVSNGNLTVTLANGTQVEFVSITDLSGHIT